MTTLLPHFKSIKLTYTHRVFGIPQKYGFFRTCFANINYYTKLTLSNSENVIYIWCLLRKGAGGYYQLMFSWCRLISFKGPVKRYTLLCKHISAVKCWYVNAWNYRRLRLSTGCKSLGGWWAVTGNQIWRFLQYKLMLVIADLGFWILSKNCILCIYLSVQLKALSPNYYAM